MSNQILIKLKEKFDNITAKYGALDDETQRNTLKEDLQFYVLNFIYHHPEYSNWTMYGGSALRICHGLDRMSVDLDFEIETQCSKDFLSKLKEEIETHFSNIYGTDSNFLNIKIVNERGLRLNFVVGSEIAISHPSKHVHVKIDLNCFLAPKMSTERIPITYGQLSFVIKTYTLSTLMASKIAAIFLRGKRATGIAIYEEKGRDIYDLLWYMRKKVTPDINYLIAKGIDVSNLKDLFVKITLKMKDVSDTNLSNDLKPLFTDKIFIDNWLSNWRENYLSMRREYSIYTVTSLKEIIVRQDQSTDHFTFTFYFDTLEKRPVSIKYVLSDYWVMYGGGDLSIGTNENISGMVKFIGEVTGKNSVYRGLLSQYIALFHLKNEAYFRKTSNEVVVDVIETKLIRMTAGKFNQEEEVFLDTVSLIACGLNDLLK